MMLLIKMFFKFEVIFEVFESAFTTLYTDKTLLVPFPTMFVQGIRIKEAAFGSCKR